MTTILSAKDFVKLVLAWKNAHPDEQARIECKLAEFGYSLIRIGDKVFLKEIDHADGTSDGVAVT